MRQLTIAGVLTNRQEVSPGMLRSLPKKYEQFDREFELLLIRKAKNDDMAAKERLVKSKMRFILKVAKKYQNQGLRLDDLMSIGSEGLLESIRRFDESRGLRLITYGKWYIEQFILRAFGEEGLLVHLPANKYNANKKAVNIATRYEQIHGFPPTAEELAEMLGKGKKVAADTIRYPTTHHTSLDAPLYNDSDKTGADNLRDDTANAGHITDYDSMKQTVWAVLRSLKPIEMEVVCAYAEIGDDTADTALDRIAQKYGKGRERLRQINVRTKKHLSTGRHGEILRQFLG